MIVHIGYHKTGTSYLQRKVFPNMEGLDFYCHSSEFDPLQDFHETSSLDLDLDKYRKNLDKIGIGNKNIFYSNETLIGPLFYMTGLNKVEIANNLKEIGVKKIMLTIRNQVDLLQSMHTQFIQEGGVAKFDYFIGDWRFAFKLDHLNFYRIINYYSQLYGKENVLIILNEDLKKNEAETIKKIEAFTNSKYVEPKDDLNPQKANRSISSLSLSFLRMVNHFTFSSHRPSNLILPNRITSWKFRYLLQRHLDPYFVSKISRKRKKIKAETHKRLEDYYRESNAKLQEEYGLDIEKYGYPL